MLVAAREPVVVADAVEAVDIAVMVVVVAAHTVVEEVRIASVGSSTVGVPDVRGHRVVAVGVLVADYHHPGNV